MKIILVGPIDTEALRRLTGLRLLLAPNGLGNMPVTNLAASFLALGISVHIVTLDSSIETIVQFKDGDLTITFCPLRAAPKFKARVRMRDLFEAEIRHLTRAIQEAGPDIVHAHWTYEYAEAAVRSGLPHLVTMHDLGWDYLFQMRDAYRLMRLMMKLRTMPRVKHLSVVGPFMIEKLWQYGYFGPVEAIANGIEIPKLYSDPSQRDLAKPVIVAVGNNGKLKNVGAAIRAFALIRQAVPGAELHLFGPGLDDAFVAGEPSVVGHGHVVHAQLMDFLSARATLLIHPSRIETFGVIIAEAKARALPIVAGRNSGGVASVVGEKGGTLADIESPDAIAQAALAFLRDRPAYLRACQDARADAEARFSDHMIADQYLRLYGKILESA
jgi:glycosyltransferase involved in cell wall biosynthesis